MNRRNTLTDKLFLKIWMALVIGILAQNSKPNNFVWAVPIIVWVLLQIASYIYSIPRSKWQDNLFLSTIVALGICLQYYDSDYLSGQAEKKIQPYLHQKNNWLLRIDDKPQKRNRSLKIKARLLSAIIDSTIHPIDEDIILYIPKQYTDSTLDYGDIIATQATIQVPTEAHYSFEFDYSQWLRRHYIYATMYTPNYRYIAHDNSWSNRVMIFPKRIRDYFEQIIDQKVLDTASNAIAKSILVGIRTDIDEELLQAYSATGTIHILSVSGLHFSVLIMMIGWIITRLIPNEQIQFLTKHSFSFQYALITGFSPPVFRSFLMFISMDRERLSRVKSSPINILFLSAVVILIFDSNQLFDIGYQLSYAALLGIMLWQSHLEWKLEFTTKWQNYLWKSTCVLISAWVFTFPFTIYYFHQVSLLGLWSNYLVIPITNISMVVGFVLLLVTASGDFICPFIHPIADFIGLLFSKLIWIQNEIILFFSHIPLANIGNLYLSTSSFIALMSCLLMVNLFFFHRDRISFRWLLFSIIILLYCVSNVRSVNEWYLLPSHRHTAIAYSANPRLHIWADTIDASQEKYFVHNLILEKGLFPDSIYRYPLMSVATNIKPKYSANPKCHATYTILCRENKSQWYDIISSTDSMMIGSNVGEYYRSRLIDSMRYYHRELLYP